MQADSGPGAEMRFDGHHVEAKGTLAQAPLGAKLARHARKVAPLVRRDGVFGQAKGAGFAGAGLHLDEGQNLSVVTDQIDFALDAGHGEVARDDRVAVAAQVPIGECFAADSGAATCRAR